jgi:hypothetical protein
MLAALNRTPLSWRFYHALLINLEDRIPSSSYTEDLEATSDRMRLMQGRTQRGGGAVGLQLPPPQTQRNLNLINTDFVDVMTSKTFT